MRISSKNLGRSISVALISLGAFKGASAATHAGRYGRRRRHAAGSGQLEEIVVTATKREEKLKDVPTAVSVISASKLQEQHIIDIEDAIRSIPSVAFSTTGGEGQDNISIRGVSSNVGSQTVGIYLDDVPLLITNSYEGVTIPKFLDMARIEVLKGRKGHCSARVPRAARSASSRICRNSMCSKAAGRSTSATPTAPEARITISRVS